CFGKNAAGQLPRLYVLGAPGQWQDFTMTVEMSRVSGKFSGVCFRGGYDSFLDDKNRLFLRKDYQIVKMTDPLDLPGDAFVKIQVVASGKDIRISINDKPQIELHDQPEATGGCGLIVHVTEAKYAAFSITSEASVDKSVKIYTAPNDGAL